MAPSIVVVPPSFAEIAEIARDMAPAGFELVVTRNNRAEIEAVSPTAEYLVCYPERANRTTRSFAPRRSSSCSSCSAPATTTLISKRRGAPGCRSATTAAPTPSRSPSTP